MPEPVFPATKPGDIFRTRQAVRFTNEPGIPITVIELYFTQTQGGGNFHEKTSSCGICHTSSNRTDLIAAENKRG